MDSSAVSPPESLVCPLTHEIFKDPVVDPEGNTYERSAIEEWLQKNGTSPITRSPLSIRDLVPNRAVKDIIANYRGVPKEVVASSDKDEIDPSKEPSIKLELVSVVNEIENNPEEVDVLISIKAPEVPTRTPTDICCVVDVSGSMGSEATLKDEKGKKEGNGLSLLDIVKHALKTIVAVMNPDDRLALVSYSSVATKVFGLTAIKSAADRKLIERKIDELDADGNTNIWDGLSMGLNLLAEDQESHRIKSLLLLTDGQPNISPPRGELQMLKRYKDSKNLPGSIHTFGFGYDINSNLLIDLAVEGEGMYCFIPDSSFVGTAFVNSSSNVMSTICDNVTVTIETKNGSQISQIYGSHLQSEASWGRSLFLGTIQSGQSKDVVVRMKIPNSKKSENSEKLENSEKSENLEKEKSQDLISVGLKYRTKDSSNFQVETSDVKFDIASRSADLQINKARLMLVDRVRESMELMKSGKLGNSGKLVENLIEIFLNSAEIKDPKMDGLVQDLKGQVLEALGKKEYYQKWGQHYLPSLMRSHLLQQCNNFKDPGIQFYGGQLFGKLRDVADEIFVKLPPPKPSIPQFNAQGHVVNVQRSVNMRSYHNRSSGCIHGDCQVEMSDGSVKSVKNVKKGDFVRTGKHAVSKVTCVIENVCYQGETMLVELSSGLRITPYHPIRLENSWKFPGDVAEAKLVSCDTVYNFILEKGHVMIVNQVECVTLGHGFQEPVVQHEYFGTDRVIEDMRSLPGYDVGHVTLHAGWMKRDEITGLAIGIEKEFVQQIAV